MMMKMEMKMSETKIKHCYICHIPENPNSEPFTAVKPVILDPANPDIKYPICPLCAELGKNKPDPMMKQSYVRMLLVKWFKKPVASPIHETFLRLRSSHDDVDQFLYLLEELRKIANSRLAWMTSSLETEITPLPPKRRVGRPRKFEDVFGFLPDDMSDLNGQIEEPKSTPEDIAHDIAAIFGDETSGHEFDSIFGEEEEE